MKTVCIDIDGTICRFTEWEGPDKFGEVLAGAPEAIQRLHENGWYVIIFSTRADKNEVSKFLHSNNIYFDAINENPHQPENAIGGKPIADVYLDDRAITFKGNWEDAYSEIINFIPWEKKDNIMVKKQFKRDILHSDFEQSMEMLRHYDNFHWDITKFCFSQICVIVGACWYIYEKSGNSMMSVTVFNLDLPVIAILLILSSLFTLLCIISLLRNRTYFCKVSHYINEMRKYSLNDNELNFPNESKMWADPAYPPLKDGLSTQSLSIYLLSFCLLLSSVFGSCMLFPSDMQVLACVLIGAAVVIILIILFFTILND